MDSQPAVITLTGDNALTIGLMGAVLYLGALLIAQGWIRYQAAQSQGMGN